MLVAIRSGRLFVGPLIGGGGGGKGSRLAAVLPALPVLLLEKVDELRVFRPAGGGGGSSKVRFCDMSMGEWLIERRRKGHLYHTVTRK